MSFRKTILQRTIANTRETQSSMSPLSPFSRITRGIRFRMSMVFLLVFLGMAGGSIWHLKNSLSPTFLRMERDQALHSAERVIGGLDAQLSNLNILTRDWAYWDDMYQFAQKPSAAFVASNMGDSSIRNVGLIGVLVLSPNAKVVGFHGSVQSNAKALRAEDLLRFQAQLMAPLSDGPRAQQCGYLRPQDLLLFLCTSRISRSDGSGAPVGVVVMVRELTVPVLREIEKQSKEYFQVLPLTQLIPVEQWSEPGMNHLMSTRLDVNYSTSTLTLDYHLPDLAGTLIRTVRLPLARTLVDEGELVTLHTAKQMATIALGTGAMLFLAGHFWLVLPIARLKRDIRAIHKQKAWGNSVGQNRGDEIGALAREVNGLLHVIHSQVQALESLSMTDPLTGLANRRRFDQRLADETRRIQRKAQPLALIVLDVDFFKQYNDHYGHPAGDIALQKVAEVMLACTRQVDLAARIGGEEFAVLVPDTTQEAAVLIAEKILLSLRSAQLPHAKSLVSPVLTASAGVAALQNGIGAAAALLDHADRALYTAKTSGRNRTSAYSGNP